MYLTNPIHRSVTLLMQPEGKERGAGLSNITTTILDGWLIDSPNRDNDQRTKYNFTKLIIIKGLVAKKKREGNENGGRALLY